MKKPTALTVLKTLALGFAMGAGANLAVHLTAGVIDPLNIALTVFAVIGVGVALADDFGRALRAILRRVHPMTGRRFRRRHGDPASWDNNEYEAYFAVTAARTTARRNIHPAA